MTEIIRYTYRPPEELYIEIAKESTRKRMAINSVITNILWNHYFTTTNTLNANSQHR